ncbi:MAG: TIGR02453 family protein [Rhodobacter sp.]|nr:TIGR02453 family protein [Rhodobacter sp.]
MTDGFTDLIDRSNTFFSELAQNNRKDWFEPRKAQFVDEIKKPAELFMTILAEDIARLTGIAHAPKLFRIYRDVRFSKDKTPYNPHLHIMWSQPGDARPAWFFGSAPDYLILGVGIMGLSGAALTQYRAYVDRHGDALAAAIADAKKSAEAEISDWGPESLKRVPKPYEPDHPQGDLLKRKALAVTAPLAGNWRTSGLIRATLGRAEGLLPVWRLMNEIGELKVS